MACGTKNAAGTAASDVSEELIAPFPYYGGKRRIAAAVWQRFGRVDVYSEPFAGSLAVLLGNPNPPKREIVCDLDGLIANVWRALAYDPDAVARFADWPTFHQDLTARHKWLVKWRAESAPRLSEDPEWFDPKAAGWWIWGRSNWIGGRWCPDVAPDRRPDPQGDRGASAGRRSLPEQRPAAGDSPGHSHGVQVQEKRPAAGVRPGQKYGVQVADHRPAAGYRPAHKHGVQIAGADLPEIGTGERLRPWFRVLQQRLARVIVFARPWQSGVTTAALADSRSSPEKLVRAVYLDPPYPAENRMADIYGKDDNGKAAEESFQWAVEHGERYRIAYSCNSGDFEVPAGWTSLAFGRCGQDVETRIPDLTMFSPACRPSGLF